MGALTNPAFPTASGPITLEGPEGPLEAHVDWPEDGEPAKPVTAAGGTSTALFYTIGGVCSRRRPRAGGRPAWGWNARLKDPRLSPALRATRETGASQ